MPVALILALIAGAHSPAAEPPLERTLSRDNDFPAATALKSPGVAWRYRSECGVSNPTVFDDTVYFGDDTGTVRALRARDGTMLWESKLGQRVFHTPFADEDGLFVATAEKVCALSRDSGQLRWEFVNPQSGRLIKVGPAVFAAGSDGVLYAIDAQTGATYWERNFLDDGLDDPPGFSGERARLSGTLARPSQCASDGQTLFQTIFDQCRVLAIDCQSGQMRWSYRTAGWIFGNPAVTPRQILVGSQDKRVHCLEKASGRVVWTFATGSRVECGAAIRGDAVFIPSCDGKLYRLGLNSGELEWEFATDPRSAIYSTPLLLGDLVCFAAGEGQLYGVDLRSGELRWKMRPAEASEMYSSPATDGRRIFVSVRVREAGKGDHGILAIDEVAPNAALAQ